MKVSTNIGTAGPPTAAAGKARLQAGRPSPYANPAVRNHYQDIARSSNQQAAMEFGRANAMANADYTAKARAAQRQAVLGGLTLLGQQQQNAYQRDQGMQDLAYGTMGNLFNLGGNLLGGLL